MSAEAITVGFQTLSFARTAELESYELRFRLRQTWSTFVEELKSEALERAQRLLGKKAPRELTLKGFVFNGEEFATYPVFVGDPCQKRCLVLGKSELSLEELGTTGVVCKRLSGDFTQLIGKEDLPSVLNALSWKGQTEIVLFPPLGYRDEIDPGVSLVLAMVAMEKSVPPVEIRKLKGLMSKGVLENYFGLHLPFLSQEKYWDNLLSLNYFISSARRAI